MDIRVQTAVIAAVVSVVVALLTPWVKNRFDKQARVEEWARKRDDWFLEKQARDAEEIIVTINNFLKIFSDDLGRLNGLIHEAVLCVVENPKREPLRPLQEQVLSIFQQHKWSAKAWFGYDSLRLSVWFEASAQVANELNELGVLFERVYTTLDHSTFMLEGTSRSSEAEEEGAYNKAVDFISELQEDTARQSKRLLEKASSIQRELIDGLRKP